MIEGFLHVNWFAVLAASVAHFLLGGAWFAGLFRKPYARALSIADLPQQELAPLFLLGPLLCGAITIATTAVLLRATGITTYGEGLALGAFVGVGYLAPMTTNIAINPLFPRPFFYALVNAPMFVIGSLMASAILVAMG